MPFMALPTELRLQIWEVAARQQQSRRITLTTALKPDAKPFFGTEVYGDNDYELVATHDVPSLLLTSHESREVALRFPRAPGTPLLTRTLKNKPILFSLQDDVLIIDNLLALKYLYERKSSCGLSFIDKPDFKIHSEEMRTIMVQLHNLVYLGKRKKSVEEWLGLFTNLACLTIIEPTKVDSSGTWIPDQYGKRRLAEYLAEEWMESKEWTTGSVTMNPGPAEITWIPHENLVQQQVENVEATQQLQLQEDSSCFQQTIMNTEADPSPTQEEGDEEDWQTEEEDKVSWTDEDDSSQWTRPDWMKSSTGWYWYDSDSDEDLM